jgi:hypothetical protein
MLDFNKTVHKETAINNAINREIDEAVLKFANSQPPRKYLGASSIGNECLRRIQWDWKKPKPATSAALSASSGVGTSSRSTSSASFGWLAST